MQKARGFTLVELSLVLVVLGLIVGGVFAGRALIEQARLRQVVTDVTQLKAVIRTFQNRYGGLPGDIAGYEFFGSRCGSDSLALDASGCNGNNNRLIEARMDASSGRDQLYESRLAWRHLEAAGYIKQSFSADYTSENVAERAYMASSIGGNTVFSINSIGYDGGWKHLGDGYLTHGTAVAPSPRTGLFIALGEPYSAGSLHDLINSGDITALMAYSIDEKIDDGAAQTGAVLTSRGNDTDPTDCGPHVSGSTNGGNAPDYILTDESKTCRMSFEVE